MSKQKGLVPPLRFPEFWDAGPWEVKRLGDVAQITMGASPKSTAYNEKGIGLPLLQGNADIKNRTSSARIFTTQITKECFVDDILLSVRAPVGSVAKSIHHACIGRGIAAIRAKKNNSQDFLYQWLLWYEPKWQHISQGGTFDSVNSNDIKQLSITIPTPNEQQKIADCLSSLDELIQAEEKALEALKKHKKGLMQQLFPAPGETTPKLRFPEFRDARPWEVKRLGAVCDFFKGKGLPKSEITPEGKIPCIHYGELFTDYGEVIRNIKSFTNSSGNYVLSKEDDVLMPTSDVTPNGLAKASCIKLSNVILGGDILIIRPYKEIVFGEYLSRFIRFRENEVLRYVSGTTVFHLYPDSISKFQVPLPIITEQQKIADCLSSLDELILAKSKRIDALKLHKKGLMQKLFPSLDKVRG